MFTIDTESGFRGRGVHHGFSYGLGETVVQGAVNPDEFYVHKPMLRSGQVRALILRRNLGSARLIEMVFTSPQEKAETGKSGEDCRGPDKVDSRNRFSHDR
jgi:pyruvate,water dikinase